MRRSATVLLGGVVLAIAGCTTGASIPAPSTTRSATSPTLSTRTTGPESAALAGLVGYPVPSLTCPRTVTTPPAGQPEPITGAVEAYWICPAIVSNGVAQHGSARIVSVRDAETFGALSAALARPGQSLSSFEPCPAMAQLPRSILVETSGGAWSARLPVDGCGFYSPALYRILTPADGQ